MLPPPPLNPDVLQTCWEPAWCDALTAEDLETVPPSSAPTFWQAGPPTELEFEPDDLHYRTIASALEI